MNIFGCHLESMKIIKHFAMMALQITLYSPIYRHAHNFFFLNVMLCLVWTVLRPLAGCSLYVHPDAKTVLHYMFKMRMNVLVVFCTLFRLFYTEIYNIL